MVGLQVEVWIYRWRPLPTTSKVCLRALAVALATTSLAGALPHRMVGTGILGGALAKGVQV